MDLRHAWQSLPPIKRHWLVNVAVGVLIEVLLHVAHQHHVGWLDDFQNQALDTVMRMSASQATKDKRVPPLVFIDVNDETWRNPAWGGGEPERAPRDRIFQLIKYAFDKKAKYVILDISVDGRIDEQDPRLAKNLETLLADGSIFTEQQRLILVRTIRTALVPQEYANELRPSALDEVIEKSHGRFAIAAPYYSLSNDRILRDWLLWSVACDQSGHWQIVPSVQLLIAAYHRGWVLDGAPWQQHQANIACPLPSGKSDTRMTERIDELNSRMWDWLGWQYKNDGEDPPDHGSLSNRILFRFGGPLLDDPLKMPIANVIPALEVIQDSPNLKYHSLENADVVIGQSFAEGHDRHATPGGEMAGSMVILNSIDSMIRNGVLHELDEWEKLLVTFALIVLVGYVFARWSSLIGTLIATSVVLAVLLFASYHLFKRGIWLDLALPLAGIQIHKLVKSYEEHIEHKRLSMLHGSSH